MNKEPTKKQAKEFWERLGYKLRKKGGIDYWYDPDNLLVNMFNFTIDLNNLFKYAPLQMTIELWRTILRGWIAKLTGDYEKDTLALFWAIWEVIHNEKTKV